MDGSNLAYKITVKVGVKYVLVYNLNTVDWFVNEVMLPKSSCPNFMDKVWGRSNNMILRRGYIQYMMQQGID